MSATIYNKAFEVELSHNFFVYPGPPASPVGNEFRINKDFEIVPSDACIDLMKRGRMRFVRTLKGFTVFYQAYLDTIPTPAEKPLVELSGSLEFIFVVRLVDNQEEVLNITDLNVTPKKYSAGSKYFLSAKNTDAEVPPSSGRIPLVPSLIDQLFPAVLTYNFRGVSGGLPFTGNVDITVKNEDNTVTVFTFTNVACDPATGIFSQSLDFSNEPKGIYHIEAKQYNTATSVHKADVYIDSALARENVFGLIRLQYTTSPPLYAGAKTFNFTFPVRTVRWRYFVSIKNDPGNYFLTRHFSVVDTNSNYYVFNPEDGQGEPNTDFKVGQNAATVIFTSASTHAYIPFCERPIKTLQLQSSDNTGGPNTRVIIPLLQNAAAVNVDTNALDPGDIDNSYAEIFVFIENVD